MDVVPFLLFCHSRSLGPIQIYKDVPDKNCEQAKNKRFYGCIGHRNYSCVRISHSLLDCSSQYRLGENQIK